MANIIQKKRFASEVKLLKNQPLHYCTAYPDETNPLIWYFLIIGQKGTQYEGGEYIGKIVHNPTYPVKPPDYYMLTPSGRYTVGTKICLTNSSYHTADWSSTWNIISILIAFYSIWLDDKEHGISHITNETPTNRAKMARESIEYNKKNNADILIKFDRTALRDSDPEPNKVSNTNTELVTKPSGTDIEINPDIIQMPMNLELDLVKSSKNKSEPKSEPEPKSELKLNETLEIPELKVLESELKLEQTKLTKTKKIKHK